jgi:O-antigen/teichoic acid export membrane protein
MSTASSRASVPPGADVDEGRPPTDLTGAVVSGALWKASTRVVAITTRFAVVVVLTRLLTPTEYGVAGMALVVASFAVLLADPALGAALVQRPTIDERDRSTAFWIAAAIGTSLTLLGLALSPLVADFYGEPQVMELFAATSLCFVVVSLSVAHRALLTRRLAYRSLEIREMVSLVSAGVVAVVVAFAGYGPWAIISNFVTYCVVSTALVWFLLDWRPKFLFSRTSARNLGGFSSKVFGAMMLSWGNSNVDTVLVGRVLGAPALGAYALAYNTTQIPVQVVSGTFLQAITPAYSRIQRDRERLERAWLRNKRMAVAVVAPSLMTLVVVAPDLVSVLFGANWDEAVTPLRLLCLGAIAISLGALNWSVLQARGEGGVLFRVSLFTSVVTWLAFVLGLAWGIVGVAAFYAGARWLLVVPTTWMTTRALSFDFAAGLRAGVAILPIAFGAAVSAAGARELMLEVGVPAAVRLVAVAGVMLTVYLGLMLVLLRPLVVDVWQVVRRRQPHDTSSKPASGESTKSETRG